MSPVSHLKTGQVWYQPITVFVLPLLVSHREPLHLLITKIMYPHVFLANREQISC